MMIKPLGTFAFCLLFFAGLILAVSSAARTLSMDDIADVPPVAAATAAVSHRSVPEIDVAARQMFAELQPQISVTESRLMPSNLAGRVYDAYSSRVANWKERRVSRRWFSRSVSTDDLTQVFRLSLGPWQAVGISREPEGFYDVKFGEQLFPAAATDMMSVAVISALPSGSRLTTYRLDGRKLAALRNWEIELPACLHAFEGQAEIVSVPFAEDGHRGLKIFRTSSLPLRAGWERRRAALAASGASVDIVMDVAGSKTMQATGDGWVANIAFAALDESTNMTETVEFLLADKKGTSRP